MEKQPYIKPEIRFIRKDGTRIPDQESLELEDSSVKSEWKEEKESLEVNRS